MYGLNLVPAPQAKSFAVVPSQGSPDSPTQSPLSDALLDDFAVSVLSLELLFTSLPELLEEPFLLSLLSELETFLLELLISDDSSSFGAETVCVQATSITANPNIPSKE